MRLAKLEIIGFKSFFHKSVFKFGTGVTGIVGPNGCGKSNIVDAVRWVMGEQNAKFLRGELADDIIFSGSQERKPLNLAEITLTFVNDDGDCPPEYVNYSEIVITRRIFRSGEKEYLINNTRCRLKDIVNFFQAAGLGARTFAIIAQGKVDQIVQAKPEDIRQTIEDCAGISIYRTRIKDTERMLGQTRENLSRVTDILTEKQKQQQSLEGQVEKARAYNDYLDALKNSEITLYSNEYKRLSEKYCQTKETLKTDTDQEIELHVSGNRLEIEEATLSQQIEPVRKELARFERETIELEQTIKHGESQQIFLKEQKDGAVKRQDLDDTETRQLALKIHDESQRKSDIDDELNALQAGANMLEERLSMAVEQLADIENAYERGQDERDKLNEETIICVENITASRNQIGSLKTQIVRADETIVGFEQRIAELDIQIQEAQAEHQRIDERVALGEQAMIQLKEELDQAAEEKCLTSDRVLELQNQVGIWERDLVSARSRLQVLDEIHEQDHKLLENEAISSLALGTFSDFIEVTPDEKTVEDPINEALNRLLQAIIIQREEDLESLRHLATEQNIAFRIICLETLIKWRARGEPFSKQVRPLVESGQLHPISNYIRFIGEHAALLKDLVSHIFVADDFATVLNWIGKTMQVPIIIISRSGEIYHADGSFHLGTAKAGNNILRRKREMQELRETVARRQVELHENQTTLEELNERVIVLNHLVDEKTIPLREEELQLKVLKRDLENIAERRGDANEHWQRYRDELQRFILEKETYADEIQALEKLAITAEERQHELRTLIAETRESLEVYTEERNIRSSEVSELRIDVATRREKLNSLHDRLHQVTRTLADNREMLERKQVGVREAEDKSKNLEATLKELAQTVTESMRRKVEVELENSSKRVEYDDLQETLRLLQASRKESTSALQRIKDKNSRAQIESSELELKMSHSCDRVLEKYQLNLAEIAIKQGDPALSEAHLKGEIQSLQQRIDHLGPVNLLAIEDFKNISQRVDFLQTQKEDIDQSMAELEGAILDSTKRARTQFLKIYDAINIHFQDLFPVLFPTGEARLELSDRENVLDAGVAIRARLPGKKMNPISLYSGGEKALTAISLIFAMLKTKPTCFCFLDEVDAPLDEANVERYNMILNKLAHQFQFIVITHNKRTVETAQNLFGITMQEPGVTKVVGVQLETRSAAVAMPPPQGAEMHAQHRHY